MAIIELKVPSPGESITDVTISKWLKKDGDYVEKDEEVAEIESDKATLTINAEDSGAIRVLVAEGESVKVGQVVCTIDNSVKGESKKAAPKAAAAQSGKAPVAEKIPAADAPAASRTTNSYANGIPAPAAKN